jgi:hypothetical protein
MIPARWPDAVYSSKGDDTDAKDAVKGNTNRLNAILIRYFC